MNINWDGETYTSNFSFVHQYGQGVTELIESEQGSTLLDLGCGNGTLTKFLKDQGYHVKGIDASPELLEIARKSYPEIEFIQADATDFFLEEPVDVVFSNAVFHWIDKEKQGSMLKCVYDALVPYGEFVFEFGGSGNNYLILKALEDVFSEYGYTYQKTCYFPTIGEYATLLEQTGFRVRYAVLFDRPTELKGETGLRDWIRMFQKFPFSVVKTEAEKEAIVSQVENRLRRVLYVRDKWFADYVRIRIRAIKPYKNS